nr:hypothetical protein [Candidatus Sigynarchaeota archaeon]
MGKKDKSDKPKDGKEDEEKAGGGKASAPGQLKKAAGEKSAKSFAPGQTKKK